MRKILDLDGAAIDHNSRVIDLIVAYVMSLDSEIRNERHSRSRARNTARNRMRDKTPMSSLTVLSDGDLGDNKGERWNRSTLVSQM